LDFRVQFVDRRPLGDSVVLLRARVGMVPPGPLPGRPRRTTT